MRRWCYLVVKKDGASKMVCSLSFNHIPVSISKNRCTFGGYKIERFTVESASLASIPTTSTAVHVWNELLHWGVERGYASPCVKSPGQI
jgi:hypothetical protein